jgi:hypothetical protein
MRRSLATATLVSVVAFAVSYVIAAVLFPGGTRAEPMRVGFSFRDNYWCDLLDTTTYGGRPNPASPIALVATVVLALGFAALSWTLPALFRSAKIRGWIVRCAGVASALVTPLIATPHHDVVVNVAAACGAITLVVTMTVVRAREGRAVLLLGLAAFASAALNFVLWRTGYLLTIIPLVQKGAFAAFLAWVFVIARRVRNVRDFQP